MVEMIRKSLSFGLMTILFLVACQAGGESRESSITTTPTATNIVMGQVLSESTLTVLPPTAVVAIKVETTSTSVVAPTASSPIAVETVMPLPTSLTPTEVAVTLTPLPTLAADELESAVGELIANPMNCDEPCWWGAIPGITSLDEIKHAVSPYNFDIYESVVDEQLTILRLGIGYIEERNDFEIRIGYGFSNSILTTVSAYSPSVFEVLARYGQPDEVWLATGITPLPIPVRLNLVYYQEGMAFGYVVDGVIENHMFKGCFTAEKAGRLRLIASNSATSYKDFPTIFEDDRRYLLLEEDTSLTMEDFMQRFSDPTQPQCIETPVELWE